MAYVTWNEKTVERFKKEGRGTGEGSHYKPWLNIGDVPSRGRTADPFGLKTGRPHQLLSKNELAFFLLVEWAPDVVDIREQYPLLDEAETQDVAMQIGAAHPYYPGTNVATVMTVDFMVTRVINGTRTLHAYDVKETSEAENEHSIGKLEIARETLQRRGIAHDLVFSTMLPSAEVANIAWIRGGQKRPNEVEPHPRFFEEQMEALAADMRSTRFTGTLEEFCMQFDSRSGVGRGTGLRVARMLMLARVIQAPLASEAHLASLPVGEFTVTGLPGQLHVVTGGKQ